MQRVFWYATPRLTIQKNTTEMQFTAPIACLCCDISTQQSLSTQGLGRESGVMLTNLYLCITAYFPLGDG